ncbi:CHASE2 domain-containing protein [Thalassomonas haliotis]|uniref:CHASE2 domain-containing protein n=1 Tax=Thalassomonas haliotis TaxID=485448 RepID=A0ABY7VDK6_9GAMM|nr:CHASE2 domain-containing protein [Thalassomonas haliotis]WDE11050.1 CHASE2 domain-containing protein [Thalassomonas haliotis]
MKWTFKKKLAFIAQLIPVVLLLVLDPFGLTSAFDNATSDALNRINSVDYSSAGQDEITVILIDEQYLSSNNTSWPISYREQAKIYRKILHYKPKALFLNIAFSHDRSTVDDPISKVFNTFKRYKKSHNTPIYLAEVESKYKNAPFEYLSAVEQSVINWQGFASKYPLQLNNNDTAALSLYREYCKKETSCELFENGDNALFAPLTVQWGSQISDSQSKEYDNSHCYKNNSNFSYLTDLIKGDLLWRFQERLFQKCPYTNTIMASSLIGNDKEANRFFKDLIKDKLVLIGTMIDSAPDLINSPVHGQVAGVYFHAMALDNLITYGEKYKRQPPDIIAKNIGVIDAIEMLFVIWVFALRYILAHGAHPTHTPKNTVQNKTAAYLWLSTFLMLAMMSYLSSNVLHYQMINWVGLTALAFSVMIYGINFNKFFEWFKGIIGNLKILIMALNNKLNNLEILKNNNKDLS